jgi:hypothetical protein
LKIRNNRKIDGNNTSVPAPRAMSINRRVTAGAAEFSMVRSGGTR